MTLIRKTGELRDFNQRQVKIAKQLRRKLNPQPLLVFADGLVMKLAKDRRQMNRMNARVPGQIAGQQVVLKLRVQSVNHLRQPGGRGSFVGEPQARGHRQHFQQQAFQHQRRAALRLLVFAIHPQGQPDQISALHVEHNVRHRRKLSQAVKPLVLYFNGKKLSAFAPDFIQMRQVRRMPDNGHRAIMDGPGSEKFAISAFQQEAEESHLVRMARQQFAIGMNQFRKNQPRNMLFVDRVAVKLPGPEMGIVFGTGVLFAHGSQGYARALPPVRPTFDSFNTKIPLSASLKAARDRDRSA